MDNDNIILVTIIIKLTNFKVGWLFIYLFLLVWYTRYMENIRIEGQIYNIIYSNANGFKIMTVNSEGKIYTVKGLLPMVNVGDYIDITGRYVEHKEYGMQIEVITYEKVTPKGEVQILEYLSSGVLKGVRRKNSTKDSRSISEKMH